MNTKYNLRKRNHSEMKSASSSLDSDEYFSDEDDEKRLVVDFKFPQMDDFIVNDLDFLQSDYIQTGWLKEIENEKDIERYQKEMKELVEEILDETPTVEKILNSQLSKKDKKEILCQLDVLNNMDTLSPDYLLLRGSIIDCLEKRSDEYQSVYEELNENWSVKIEKLDADKEIKSTLFMLSEELRGSTLNAETSCKEEKLEKMCKLPYNRSKKMISMDSADFIEKSSKILDENIYKMDDVKKRILSILSKRILFGDETGCVIGLCGPPGVGKTQISSAIAKCMNLPFSQFTLGTTNDKTSIFGSDNSWIGSDCGGIAKCLISMGVNNGVILIDELDKVDDKIMNSINHLLDPTSNHDIRDRFLKDVPMDCSKCIFIVTMNDSSVLPNYLKSRIPILNIPKYTLQDKFEITKRYKLPHMQIPKGISFSNESIRKLVSISKEPGYRTTYKHLQIVLNNLYLHVCMKGRKFKHCKLKDFTLPYIVKEKDIVNLLENCDSQFDLPDHMYI